MLKRFLSIFLVTLFCFASYGQSSGFAASYYVDGSKEKYHNRSHTSIEAMDQGSSVVYATNGANLILTKLRMTKTSGGVNDDSHRATGLNSVLLADKESNVLVEFCEVTSHTAYADGVTVSGNATKIRLVEGTVTMSRASCAAVNATQSGSIVAQKTIVNTQLGISPLFYASNSGQIDLTEVTGGSQGQASPLFHVLSTGNIHASKCSLTSAKYTIGNVDGGILDLYGNELKSGRDCGFMLYGAKSADGNGVLNLTKNRIQVDDGPLFMVTNTTATITVANNKISSRSDDLMTVRADEWGKEGENGGHASLYVEKQSLKGNITVDGISSLNLELKKGGKLNGQINGTRNSEADVRVVMDAGSVWTSKGESYVKSIVFVQPVEKGLKQLKGKHTIYYDPNDPDNAPLGGKEYKTGGGVLCPLK